MILASSQNDTQCVENPTGEVSLNVAVRGVPGPEGPQGPKGVIGPRGNIGVKGDRGKRGEKGERGDTGSMGPQGMKGAIGSKGQKGVRGIQGIPGPVGAPGLEGPIGSSGRPGPEGARGPQGRAGLPGPRGPQGEPGDTVLTEDEFTRVTRTVHSSVFTDLNATFANKLQLIEDSLSKLHMRQVQCGRSGHGRRIAYFDTTSGDSCPSALRTVRNTTSTTSKTACGRRIYSYGCTSLNFTSGGKYTNVCGKVRGYQYYDAEPFNFLSIDSPYLTGVSVTHGSPRRHLWSYIVGKSEQSYSYRCPCSKRIRDGESSVPSFIGEHFYCESGFVTASENRIAWEDPLWDGEGCYAQNNLCCQHFGWFHRHIASTSDNIEVRWCADSQYEDVFTDQLEIWVS